jgi:BirA family biotin operon repressor/biotin-[acetyl-CoA-carboxylase] ligase
VRPLPGRLLTTEAIRSCLTTHVIGATLYVHDEVDSTNRHAADLAQAGTPDGTVVVADAQTKGRGRLGRHWVSPAGMNLYTSILLARVRNSFVLTRIPLMAAIAVVRAVRHTTGHPLRIKWPNDVLAYRDGQGRKLAGILAETAGGPQESARPVVVGIGINVNMPVEAFPDELRSIATSLLIETGRHTDRITLLARLLLEVEHLYESALEHGADGLLAAYCELCDTLGKQVRIELVGGGHAEGTAEAVAGDGALRLRVNDGTVLEFRAGDVVHLR